MVCPLRKSFYPVLNIWVNFFLHRQNRVKWILCACQVELVYKWRSFWLNFYPLFEFGDDHVCALSKMVPNNLSSMHWIVVLVRFVYGFVFYTTFIRPRFGRWVCDLHNLLFVHVLDDEFVIDTILIRPWLGRIFLWLHPVLSFRRMYLSVYFSF